MEATSFLCLTLSPSDLAHPGLAVAGARAGGVGLLDLEFCRDSDRALSNVNAMLASLADADGGTGLRMHIDRLAEQAQFVEAFGDRPMYLLLSGVTPETSWDTLKELAAGGRRTILLEVNSVEQARALLETDSEHGIISGLVAKGHESGGWVGDDTSYILTQKMMHLETDVPVYIQGGIGIHTASACRAAGAAGVVLDDQLLLLRESPLPVEWRHNLEGINGKEAMPLGERLGKPLRFLTRPGFEIVSTLQKLNDAKEVASGESATAADEWRHEAQELIGWSEPGELAWPVGQAVGLAALYRDRYRTTGRLIRAIQRESVRHIKLAKELKPLAPDSPLAVSHGTKYPIIQGPMSRVSDRVEWAEVLAQNGGLPMHALGTMPPEMVRDLLTETNKKLNDRPWGTGLIGFVPAELYNAQVKELLDAKPKFALIAGGRPDQAAVLEEAGIGTYIHAPAPELQKMFYEAGTRRFVFEGRECGGHIGPLSSFMLWESAVDMFLDIVPKGKEGEVHIIFAGGIHDPLSSAMVSVIAAPAVERGMKLGVIMGTAYLFTKEAVETGAIVEKFQRLAVNCHRTVNLEARIGHANRVIDTPITGEFFSKRRSLLTEGKTPDEIFEELDGLTMGRMPIATRGIKYNEKGQPVDLDEEEQYEKGMYLIGQLATIRDSVISMRELHEEIATGGTEFLEKTSPGELKETETYQASPSDVAIIGMAAFLPQAADVEEYWDNILKKLDVVQEIPESRFDWRLYYDEDRTARDKIYSRYGGFIKDVPFDPLRYGIPPNNIKSIDPMQFLALEAARLAIEDAGYANGDFDRENTAVVVGASGGVGDRGLQYAVRCELPQRVELVRDKVWDRMPEWTEESFAGLLFNVIAGRIGNRLDLGGLNQTTDAACASSLAAIHVAVASLESGQSNMALAGGVDTSLNPFGYTAFSKTQALTPGDRARPFDKDGDGILIGEGVNMVVLKRLADARRDGDRIYAVIKSVGSSSDGKSKGLTAPHPAGQVRALKRAYNKAGFPPSTLGLLEAHGTGTVAGDNAEAETIVTSLRDHDTPPKTIVLGSIKAQVGHTKAAAGITSLIKGAMSLYHKVQPPHMNVENPLEPLADKESPVYLAKEARPWVAHPDHPRRAGVSAFGFGGTNYHVVLEEYDGNVAGVTPGADKWPFEVMVIRAKDREALEKEINNLLKALASGAEPRLRDLAYSYALKADAHRDWPVCLSFVVGDLDQLADVLSRVLPHVTGKVDKPLEPHVNLEFEKRFDDARVAFLFPGQGSQYPDMTRETTLYFHELRRAIEFADRQLRENYPKFLSQYIFPPSPFTPEEEKRNIKELLDTHVAQPALSTLGIGFMDIARMMGLEPDMVAGHSIGEYTALAAAGAYSREVCLRLVETRGRVMARSASEKPGTMAAVKLTREEVATRIEGFEGVVIANHNSPEQTVISGPLDGVKAAVKKLKSEGVTARLLPVAGAFHSALFESSQGPLVEAIGSASITAPSVPVYGNRSGDPYPEDPGAIKEQLSAHLLRSVEFVSQIEKMYSDGARIFVELGPKNVLSQLTNHILKGKDFIAVSFDGQGGGLRGFLRAVSLLASKGIRLELHSLFTGRDVRSLNLTRLAVETRPVPLSPTTWLLDGSDARPLNEKMGKSGKLPALDLESREQERAAFLEELADEIPAKQVIIEKEVQVPTSQPGAQVPAAPSAAVYPAEAFEAYQQTMRQFLGLQERVIQSYLTGGPVRIPSAPAAPSPAVAPVPPPPPHAAPPPPPPQASPEPAPAAVEPESTPEPAAETAAPAEAIDRAMVEKLLIGLVSERTGYPEDMLGLDQDMEADLGIDSIKRVEILGSLQKNLPEAVAPQIQSEMEAFTRAKTLGEILDKMEELAESMPTAPAAASAPSPADAGEKAAAQKQHLPNRDEVTKLLIGLVSERTGYPEDMLELDQDMEADLGIDSIKRVEILGSLQKGLSSAAAPQIQEEMETFTRAKTLREIIDHLMSLAPPAEAVETLKEADQAAPKTETGAPGYTPPDEEEVTKLLISLVSERTGYPEDMLELDQDMEADLGIDSIKRVEILGSLQQSLSQALAPVIQSEMESFTRAKTLREVIDKLMSLAPEADVPTEPAPAESPAEQPSATAETPSSIPALDREKISSILIGLVSERTGYPEDMLELDQDMEADLGIDSIKRVEILGGMQKYLPEELAPYLQEQMETLTRAKTLNDIINMLTEIDTSAVPSAAETAVEVSEQTSGSGNGSNGRQAELETVSRYEVKPVEEPLNGVDTASAGFKGLYLVTEDPLGVTPLVVEALSAKGAKPALIDSDTLADPERLSARIEELRKTDGPVNGVIHLAGLGAFDPPADLAGWRRLTRLHVRSLFQILHLCATDLDDAAKAGHGRVLSATLLGGLFGRNGFDGSGLPSGGGNSGLLKAMRLEWPGILARAVDFDPALSVDEISARIMDELSGDAARVEVGYPGGVRTAFATTSAPHQPDYMDDKVEPDADWVVLVTGGARGITAEIAAELASAGLTLILAGRSHLPEEEADDTRGIEDVGKLRSIFIDQLKAAGEKITPVIIEKKVGALMRNREIRRNIERFRDAGATVEYVSVDVADEEKFSALLEDIYERFGRLDGVIHGAGIIEDKLIADKSEDSFDRVFQTKVDSTFILNKHLRAESLKLVVFFTSVAGRYGSAGQTDYAAANQVVSRFASRMDARWPYVRVISIDWGPWDSGMVNDELRAHFKELGIIPIPLKAGRRFFRDELKHGRKGVVEVIASEGSWKGREA